jgi:hypothetical protein
MFNKKSTNADIALFDWAKRDRATLLRSLHARRVPRPAAASSGWGGDVAGNDPRSVHAYLRGKGDLRMAWWNLFSSVYLMIVPGASLERAMYTFHALHHTLTLARLNFATSVGETASDIERDGLRTALQRSFTREIER